MIKEIKKDVQKIEKFLKSHKKKITIGIILYLIYTWLMNEE